MSCAFAFASARARARACICICERASISRSEEAGVRFGR